MEYEGTIILVSHDRDFLDGLSHRLFEFREGHVKEHLCDIKEFMEKRKLERLLELKSVVQPVAVAKPVEKVKIVDADLEKEKQLKLAKQKIAKCEEKIAVLEEDIKKLDEQLADPEIYKEIASDKSFFENYDRLKLKMTELMKEWEELTEKIS